MDQGDRVDMGSMRSGRPSTGRRSPTDVPVRVMQAVYVIQALVPLGYFLVRPLVELTGGGVVPPPSQVFLTVFAVPTVVMAVTTWWRRTWSNELAYLFILSIFMYPFLCAIYRTWWPAVCSLAALIFVTASIARFRRHGSSHSARGGQWRPR
jgi:prepilin signal peptidase PulO-like enzyme (type II secretory pathway)